MKLWNFMKYKMLPAIFIEDKIEISYKQLAFTRANYHRKFALDTLCYIMGIQILGE